MATLPEWERQVEGFIRQYPARVADALTAIVAGPMVRHARGEHGRMEPAEQRLAAYRSIALRRAGGKPRTSGTAAFSAYAGTEGGPRFRTRSGLLAASIGVGGSGRDGGILFVELVARADYAYFVEFGSSVNAPYPFMRPAVEEHRDALRKAIIRAIKRAAKDSGAFLPGGGDEGGAPSAPRGPQGRDVRGRFTKKG